MKTELFEIQYLDPVTKQIVKFEGEFPMTPELSAALQAEDLAYTLADKGWHQVRPLPPKDGPDPVWNDMKVYFKGKFDADRGRFLEEAKAKDDGGWKKHTDYHWSRTVSGHRLDYWPSRKKYQFKGCVMRGDVYAFIRRQEKACF